MKKPSAGEPYPGKLGKYLGGYYDEYGNIVLKITDPFRAQFFEGAYSLPSSPVINGKKHYFVLKNDSLKGLERIKTLIISEDVIAIEGNPFIYCDGLEKIIVSENNPVFSSEDGVVLNKQKDTVLFCTKEAARKFVSKGTIKNISHSAWITFNVVGRFNSPQWIEQKEAVANVIGLLLNRNNAATQKQKLSSLISSLQNRDARGKTPVKNLNVSFGEVKKETAKSANKPSIKSTSSPVVKKFESSNNISENIQTIFTAIVIIGAVIFAIAFLRSCYDDMKSQAIKKRSIYPSVVSPNVKIYDVTPIEEEKPKENKNEEENKNGGKSGGYVPNYPVYPNVINPVVPIEDTRQEELQRWENYYRESYSRYERLAMNQYESLTRKGMGGRYMDNGVPSGYTTRDDVYVANEIHQLQKYQNEMRKIRHEASTKGINIPQSIYENVTVNL